MANNNEQQQQQQHQKEQEKLHNGTSMHHALHIAQYQMPYRKGKFHKFFPFKVLQKLLSPTKFLKANNSTTKAHFHALRNVTDNFSNNIILKFIDPTTTTLRLFLFSLIIVSFNCKAFGEGNVGCKFVQTLCLDDKEVCYDDNIFGKCIPTSGINLEEIEKSPLTQEQSHLLATMLEEMQGNGLGWDHPYVQCRIQGTLFSLEKQTPLPPNLCSNLSPLPSSEDFISSPAYMYIAPLEEFASDYDTEKYFYPPLKKQHYKTDALSQILHKLRLQNEYERHGGNDMLFNEINNNYIKFDDNSESHINWPGFTKSFTQSDIDKIFPQELTRKSAKAPHEVASHDDIQFRYQLPNTKSLLRPQLTASNLSKHEKRVSSSNNSIPPKNFSPKDQKFLNTLNEDNPKLKESTFRELSQLRNTLPAQLKSTRQTTEDFLDPFIQYNSKEGKIFQLDESLRRNTFIPFEDDTVLLAHSTYPKTIKPHQSKQIFSLNADEPLVSTEMSITKNSNSIEEQKRKNIMREFFANILGFTRHERLDVKKPGPLVGPPLTDSKEELEKQYMINGNITKENIPNQHQIGNDNETKKNKKLIKGHSDEDHSLHTVDTEYAHVFVEDSIESWSDGVRIMKELANILQLPGYLNYLTVQPHEISFRVNSSNPKHASALDVAQAINENRGIKNKILRRLGVTILKAGVGDKVKWDDDNEVSASYLQATNDNASISYILIYMFTGAGTAAIVILCVTLILIKRHDRKRNKLKVLQTTTTSGIDTCSKDYQELCRARMANKGEPIAGNRILSVNKENEWPPSSRSSTSSWSEEPVLTNMDISTGHIVLSYMEDHLKNKDRLQREWEALCRYQAEPATRDAALQPQCINLNRPEAPLPYDHSRVVLNHLANAEGLDYINASTITDHDPRTPAYIAAQGPLPTTLAHFWQMIWEQGAVVIVALCRLQENGGKACTRYWPEEGAEVYHIYEVHLVSEHIWCDDYLVRSFYLKNLRTSETRTVTQFHFLSWPQDGIPMQAKPLLDFRRKVNKSYRGRSCPIVVHSSNGAGRTGAYILLDLVLGRMNKGAREIDIAATLEHLRDQRAGLVTTRQQFEFVLMSVAEEVHATLRALPANAAAVTLDKKELNIKGEQNLLKEE